MYKKIPAVVTAIVISLGVMGGGLPDRVGGEPVCASAASTRLLTPNDMAKELRYQLRLYVEFKDNTSADLVMTYFITNNPDDKIFRVDPIKYSKVEEVARSCGKTMADVKQIGVGIKADDPMNFRGMNGVYDLDCKVGLSYEAIYESGETASHSFDSSNAHLKVGGGSWDFFGFLSLDSKVYGKLDKLNLKIYLDLTHAKAYDPSKPLPGDLDEDGKLTVKDITLLSAHLKGLKPLTDRQLKAADTDFDSEVTTADITALAAAVKGLKPLY